MNKKPPLPRGPLEDCGAFAVWWYQRHSGRSDNTPIVTEWAYARRSPDGLSWLVSHTASGFASRTAAVESASESE